jgi:enamine deaminase RidA (YjgF/YER057c/UK114 family)
MTLPSQPQFINPPGLATPRGFSHVAIGSPQPVVYVSGQIACDSTGAVVGAGDIGAQTRQVFLNLKAALEAAGSDFRHVLKLTVFVKNLTPERAAQIRAVRSEFLDANQPPASTMIGISALARDELEIEVEAYAMTAQ